MRAVARYAEFLSFLFDGIEGLVELRVTPQDRTGSLLDRRWVNVASVNDVVRDLLGVYRDTPSMIAFGINVRQSAGGCDRDVDNVSTVCIDLDGKKHEIAEQHRLLCEVARYAPPSVIASSGTPGHVHAYWRLRPITAEIERTRSIVKRLRTHLKADPSEQPSKMMRLPGTPNWKSGVSVNTEAWIEDGQSCMLDQLEGALDLVDAPAVTTRLRVEVPCADWSDTPPTVERITYLWDGLSSTLKTQMTAEYEDGYGLRHPRDAAVVRGLVELGATDVEVCWFFAKLPASLGAKLRDESPSYLRRTIAWVRASYTPPATVLVEHVEPAPPNGRVNMNLRVTGGPYEGCTLDHGVSSMSTSWEWLWRSAGLQPPPRGQTNWCLWLQGRDLRVHLAIGAADRLQVQRWLPSPPRF